MKNRKLLEVMIVILAIFGYVAVSVYIFYEAFQLSKDPQYETNTAIAYIASGLTGLVGGIVAVAFGVEQDIPPNDPLIKVVDHSSPKRMAMKTKSLGSLSSPNPSNGNNHREKIGMIYTVAYILIGLAAIIIWVFLDEKASQSVKNMATTFLGLVLPIVIAYFK